MAIVRPFRALRPRPDLASEIVCLPYDVVGRAEAKKLAGDNQKSFYRVIRAEIDLPESLSPYDGSVYDRARDNLRDFERQGILAQDQKPMFYVYRQCMDGRVQVGLTACVSIDDYEAGLIKKHELTLHEKEQDRVDHFDRCAANTEPVFLTYRHKPEVSAILRAVMEASKPEYDIVTPDGISHQLWPVQDDGDITRLTALFEGDCLYIADGHHRSASANRVGHMKRDANPGYSGNEEFNFFMAVLFDAGELMIMDYNRVVKDLNGLSPRAFFEAISNKFTVHSAVEDNRPTRKHQFSMYHDYRWYILEAKEGTWPDDPVGSLDAAILQENLLSPVLGIDDPRKSKRIEFVGGIRGYDELKARADACGGVAFGLYPVSIDDLMSVADQGLCMPPKSTWFEPKLASGLFIHKF